jgi:site-specific DNA-methyltransferase (adenine-specific)
VPVTSLRSYPGNPRRSDVEAIRESIRQHGIYRHIVVNRRDSTVLAGNHLLEAAEAEGYLEVPVSYVDVDEEEAARIVLVDNRLSDLGSYDEVDLLALINRLPDLSGTGYSQDDLDALAASLHGDGGGTPVEDLEPQIDRAEELRQQYGVELGQLWALGEHRLICGDCTNPATYAALLAESVAITITSPPYNQGGNSLPNTTKYAKDADLRGTDAYRDLLMEATSLALAHSSYVFVNVQQLAGNKVPVLEWLFALRAHLADTIIWDKLAAEPAMAGNVLNSRFEFVYVFSAEGKRTIGTAPFRGTLENVLALPSRQGNELADVHRAVFPLDFAAHFIANFCQQGEQVLDPFCGTGTTLLACEQHGRLGRGIELDPGYIAVALDRWAQATGKTPELLP